MESPRGRVFGDLIGDMGGGSGGCSVGGAGLSGDWGAMSFLHIFGVGETEAEADAGVRRWDDRNGDRFGDLTSSFRCGEGALRHGALLSADKLMSAPCRRRERQSPHEREMEARRSAETP